MAAVNTRRVLLGALAGGVVWNIWSFIVNGKILAARYLAAENAGVLLKQPRYPFFVGYWIILLFLLAGIMAWLYASARATRGAGPATALKLGVLVGFASGFPISFSMTSWGTIGRSIPLWWMLDLWVGAILATLVAGWLYRD
jgi:hypothetical protein